MVKFETEAEYYDFLSDYVKGIQFEMIINGRNGEVPGEVYLDYVKSSPDETPKSCLRFVDGNAIFDPKTIGGVKNIKSLDAHFLPEEKEPTGIC